MKGLIIYKGKYAATDQYAQWLSKALALPALSPAQVSSHQLSGADVLVIGTSVYIGKFQLRDWLQKNTSAIKGKKLFLFVVVGSALTEREKLEGFITANVPAEIRVKAEIYFLPGKLEYASLSWLDKILLRMGAAFTKDPVQKKRMLTDYNEVKKVHLKALIQSFIKYSGKLSENSQYAQEV